MSNTNFENGIPLVFNVSTKYFGIAPDAERATRHFIAYLLSLPVLMCGPHSTDTAIKIDTVAVQGQT